MSVIFEITKPIIQQLIAATRTLTNLEYSASLPILNGSSIGGHVRHVAELYQCLLTGLDSGIVNYENRERDRELEQNVQKAIFVLDDICDRISQQNSELVLQGNFSETDDDDIVVGTNYYREVIYNLEHCIHHMALIRIGLSALGVTNLPHNFGVAPSTIKHQQACAH
jgi:hypothetical protein